MFWWRVRVGVECVFERPNLEVVWMSNGNSFLKMIMEMVACMYTIEASMDT
jgi:hypothetical protein